MSSLYNPLIILPWALLLLSSSGVCGEDGLRFEQSNTPPPGYHVAPETGCGEGYCHIEDRCVPAGHRDANPNSCWICIPRQSTVAWSYSKDEHCVHGTEHLDTWHLILIIVGSVLLVVMLVSLASYRIRRHMLKRQRVYESHYIDVPHDGPLLKQMH